MRLLATILFLFSMFQGAAQEAWTQLNDFPFEGPVRSSYSVDGDILVIGNNWNSDKVNVYKYDVDNDTFSIEYVVPVVFRAPFIVNGKFYSVELDGDRSVNIWEYDPQTEILSQKNDAVDDFFTFGFFTPLTWVIDGEAYLGLPGNTESDSMLKYDTINDEWVAVAPYIGPFDSSVTSFVVDGKAYTLFGRQDLESEPSKSLFVYDPELDF